jgi:phosphoglycerate dehydrogenase-like enzyme
MDEFERPHELGDSMTREPRWLPNTPQRIVVPDDYPQVFAGTAAEKALRALGDLTVFTERGADDPAEAARRIGGADVALVLRAHCHVTQQVLEACSNVRMISIWGSGTDNVDLAACRVRGITVTNTPGVNAHAVAEHAIALMLSVARRIPQVDDDLRAGGWERGVNLQLEGKTLGLIGLGRIASRVAHLANAFGMTVLAHSLRPDGGRAAAMGARAVSLEELLAESDYVSLHLRHNAETEGYLSRERIALMKPSAFLINTARGRLVDEEALVEALREERLAGAGLDVFRTEPLPAGHPLAALPNVVITPHNAGNTPEVIAAGLAKAVQNIAEWMKGKAANVVD